MPSTPRIWSAAPPAHRARRRDDDVCLRPSAAPDSPPLPSHLAPPRVRRQAREGQSVAVGHDRRRGHSDRARSLGPARALERRRRESGPPGPAGDGDPDGNHPTETEAQQPTNTQETQPTTTRTEAGGRASESARRGRRRRVPRRPQGAERERGAGRRARVRGRQGERRGGQGAEGRREGQEGREPPQSEAQKKPRPKPRRPTREAAARRQGTRGRRVRQGDDRDRRRDPKCRSLDEGLKSAADEVTALVPKCKESIAAAGG